MNAILNLSHGPMTMSSREIADLCVKNHSHVIRDIRTMLDALKDDPELDHVVETQDARGYTSEIALSKALTITLVTGYDVVRRHMVMKRWMELESGASSFDPANLSRMDILKLAMDSEQGRLKAEAQLAIAAPKAQALDLIAAGDEALTVTQAAKVLGIKRQDLTNWLHANGWMYRQNGSWVAYQQHIQNGRLQFKEARYTDENTGQECHRPYCHITPKGLAVLAKHFASN